MSPKTALAHQGICVFAFLLPFFCYAEAIPTQNKEVKLPKDVINYLMNDIRLLPLRDRQAFRKAQWQKLQRKDLFKVSIRKPELLPSKTLKAWLEAGGDTTVLATSIINNSNNLDWVRLLVETGAHRSKDNGIKTLAYSAMKGYPDEPFVLEEAKKILRDSSGEKSRLFAYGVLGNQFDEDSLVTLLEELDKVNSGKPNPLLQKKLHEHIENKLLMHPTLSKRLKAKALDYTLKNINSGKDRLLYRLFDWDAETGNQWLRKNLSIKNLDRPIPFYRLTPKTKNSIKHFIEDPKNFLSWIKTPKALSLLLSIYPKKELLKLLKKHEPHVPKEEQYQLVGPLLSTNSKEGTNLGNRIYQSLPATHKAKLLQQLHSVEFPKKMAREVLRTALHQPGCSVPEGFYGPSYQLKKKEAVATKPKTVAVPAGPAHSFMDTLKDFPAEILSKTIKCIEFPSSSAQSICNWIDYSFDAKAPIEKITPTLSKRMQTASPQFNHKIASCIAPYLRLPQDKTFTQSIIQKLLPNKKALEEESVRTELLRDKLDPDGKALLDAHIRKLAKPNLSPDTPNACEVICRLRKSSGDWLDPKFFRTSEFGENMSEHHFAISNVVSLFNQKTKTLCEGEKKNAFPKTFATLPPALKYSSSASHRKQNEIKQLKKREHALQQKETFHKFNTKLGTLLENHGVISKEAQKKWQQTADKNLKNATEKVQYRPISQPGKLSNSILYSLIFGELLVKEVGSEKAPPKWKQSIERGHNIALKNFKEHLILNGNSGYTNYAVAASVLATDSPPERVLEYMKDTVKELKDPCTVPYDHRKTHNPIPELDVFRSVTFYSALRKHTSGKEKAHYTKQLVTCLKKYKTSAVEFWAQGKRGISTHIGKRQGAPYYLYGTIAFATEAIFDILTDPETPSDLKNSVKRSGHEISALLRSEFQKDKGTFIDTSTKHYRNRPTYTNALYGLAMVPFCRFEEEKVLNF